MATIVLVHGAGHGSWCWERLVPLLRDAGHAVFAPTLTGVGERFGELTARVNLSTHIDDIAALIEAQGLTEIVLVGHSYGCMVITGVADRVPGRIAQLVFIDGPHPVSGESILDAIPIMREAIENGMREVDGVELCLFPEPDTIGTLFGIIEPADVAWAQANLTPQPWNCFLERLHLVDEAAVRSIPRASIDCLRSATQIDPDMVARSKAADLFHLVDTGHDPMITAPAELAALLTGIAQSCERIAAD